MSPASADVEITPIAEGPIVRSENRSRSPVASKPDKISCQGCSDRKDTTTVFPYARGSKSLALQIAGDRSLCIQAYDEIRSLAYANGSRGTRESHLSLWDDISASAGLDSTRFDEEIVYTLVGVLRKSRYRSSEQNISPCLP